MDRREKLQHQLRKVSAVVSTPHPRQFTPALPHGEGLERFQDMSHALCSWEDKQMQWWYFTGHLQNKDGRQFGFQLVFFERHAHQDFIGFFPTRWMTGEFFVAHFAITDPEASAKEDCFRYWQKGGIFSNYTGFSTTDRFHIAVDGWHAYRRNDQTIVLHANTDGVSFNLELKPEKPPCYHGRQGYTQKAEPIHDASFYCSYTRLKANGKLLLDGKLHDLSGQAWMDHEKMSIDDRILHWGWDWYSIQLSNHEELMIYLLKDRKGNIRSHSMGTLFDADGLPHSIRLDEIHRKPLKHWTSQDSNGKYPVSQRIRIPRLKLDLEIHPLVENQEMDTTRTTFTTYWEGAVLVEGEHKHNPVKGCGYMELVGYDRRPKSQLFRFLTIPPQKSV